MLDRPENADVLSYLHVEQRPEWRDSTSIWIVDGYPLNTHPDLCDRVKDVNDAAGRVATLRYLYGRPALLAPNGVIVAFATGTHTFCVRLRPGECDSDLAATRGPEPRSLLLRRKQRELDALTNDDWTRLDPFAISAPSGEGLAQLAAHIDRAVAKAACVP